MQLYINLLSSPQSRHVKHISQPNKVEVHIWIVKEKYLQATHKGNLSHQWLHHHPHPSRDLNEKKSHLHTFSTAIKYSSSYKRFFSSNIWHLLKILHQETSLIQPHSVLSTISFVHLFSPHFNVSIFQHNSFHIFMCYYPP